MALVWEDFLFFLGAIWAAVVVGVLVGWAWKPRWAHLGRGKLGFAVESEGGSSRWEGLGLSSLSFSLVPSFYSIKAQWQQNLVGWVWEDKVDKERFEKEVADSECWYASVWFLLFFLIHDSCVNCLSFEFF